MDQSTARNNMCSGEDHTCTCGKEKAQRQDSRRSSNPFAGVTNPPNMYSDSAANQESDLITGSPVSLESQLQVAQRQIAQLLREKQDAFRQVKEVTKMNTRWQKYDKEREEVVSDLTTKYQRAQDRLKEMKEKSQHLEAKVREQRDRSEELELRWTDARVRASERKSELERVQRENQILEQNFKQAEKKRQEANKRLEAATKHEGARREEGHRTKRDAEKDRDLYHMSKRVVDLKEQNDHIQKKLEAAKKQLDEQADLYSQQISICLDDFKQEKREKDRLKKENDDIKKQLKKAEDFASSLKVQITKYQNQQRTHPRRAHHQSARHFSKFYGNIYEDLDDSWDDAGYALPCDVVPDHAQGFDEVDAAVAKPGHVNASDVMGPPPQYDDRSIMGQVVALPKTTMNRSTSRIDDLVLH